MKAIETTSDDKHFSCVKVLSVFIRRAGACTSRPDDARYFEDCVVVGINPNTVEIIVFSCGADTFLGISHAGAKRSGLSEKNRRKLVHINICES
jgi:hypothetical protein